MLNNIFKYKSIKKQLVLIIISACAFTITLGLMIYSVYDIVNNKRELKNNASLNATLIGEYCSAALIFGYQNEAAEILKKIEIMPDILNACLYDKNNNIFAYYNKDPKDKISFLIKDVQQAEYFGNHLHVFKPIFNQNEISGAIYLRVSTATLKDKIIGNMIIFFILLLLLSGPVILVASKLQRSVSEPILKLADITTQVAQNKDYSLRVITDRKDSIGILYNRFNEMFEQIERQQKEVELANFSLMKLNEELESRVSLRTNELENSNRELKFAEKTIKESEQRLKDILNHAPILVYINDLEGRYIFVNREFERVTGLSFDYVIGKTDMDLFTADKAEINIAQNSKVIETQQVQIFENTSQIKNDIHYFVNIIFPIANSNNHIYATSGWALDITDRKNVEDALKKAKEKAESADYLKSAFLATMSHELRTPLNSIIGFTGIVLKGLAGALNAEQTKQLNMVKGSGQHLLALINDVLDISKIEAGELVVTYKPFDFNKSLNKVLAILQPLAEKKGLLLYSYISPLVNIVISDERRVEQIFLNIINNAIKFTEKGFIDINCEKQDNSILIKISDTGIGIAKENMDKLFKPFSQIDSGLTRNHEGTGLGLSICKKLLDKLGGSIRIESAIDSGSIFTILLPISREETNASKSTDN